MSDQNTRLLVHLKELQQSPLGYMALQCHLSSLPQSARTRDNLSQAISVLNELKRGTKMGQIFLLGNLEVVFTGYDVLPGALRTAGSKIHKLFGRPELRKKNPYGGEDFYTVFDIAANGKRLLEFAETLAGMAESDAGAKGESKVIDGTLLTRIKARIQASDLSSMVLNQPVYTYDTATGKMVPLFHELYVSIKALEDSFCPGVSLTRSRWLFSDLTEDLDGAVLRMLSRSSELARKRFSLNLNISALASAGFRDLDAKLDQAQRANIVIEIHRNDLVANFALYRKLAPMLVAKGYSLCLDALEGPLLPHFDLKGLHFRFAKVFWSDDAPEASAWLRGQVDGKTDDDNGVTYILARCDKAEAVQMAKTVGIELLQGKLIDHMARNNIPA